MVTIDINAKFLVTLPSKLEIALGHGCVLMFVCPDYTVLHRDHFLFHDSNDVHAVWAHNLY